MALTRSEQRMIQNLTVYGYIREEYECVPDDIKDLCLEFYLKVYDQWNVNKSNSIFDIDADLGIIKAGYDEATKIHHTWNDAFGSLVIKAGDIQTWNLKQLHQKSSVIYIGIVDESKADQDMKGFCSDANQAGYAIENSGSIYDGMNQKGSRSTGNSNLFGSDLIQLTLDMRQDNNNQYGILTIKINDKGYVIQDKVDMNKQYLLAICVRMVSREHNKYKIQLDID